MITRIYLALFIQGSNTKSWKSHGLDLIRNTNLLNEFKFPSHKQPVVENDTSQIKEENTSNIFLSKYDNAQTDDKEIVCNKSKGHSQIKEERTVVLKSPTLAYVENQTEINKRLLLTNEHLYKNKIRVLTHMGGLFYAGYLSPLQPPDVYAVALDGERGNKSHIMSREEVLKDTVGHFFI